jgi:hypothetical protein
MNDKCEEVARRRCMDKDMSMRGERQKGERTTEINSLIVINKGGRLIKNRRSLGKQAKIHICSNVAICSFFITLSSRLLVCGNAKAQFRIEHWERAYIAYFNIHILHRN